MAISNSYGGSEDSTETSYDGDYNHPGIAITVSSGDSGYGVEYPAASPNVTAVGGTTLTQASNARGWSESAWSLFDVTTGSNGSCSGSYLCTAAAGYDGPTGLGTPNGVGGF